MGTLNLDAKFFGEILQKYENLSDLMICEVYNETGTAPGDNYMSEVCRVYVDGYKYGDFCKDNKTLTYDYTKRLMVKLPLEQDLHNSEVNAYEKIIPELSTYLPLHHSFKFPKMVLANSDMMIMEDLGQLGYEKLDRSKALPEETTKAVLKEIAKFHATSIIMKHQSRNDFDNISSCLVDQLMSNVHKERSRSTFFDAFNVSKYRSTFDDFWFNVEDSEERLRLKEFFQLDADELFEQAFQEINIVPEELEVIIHGDFWHNNILYKNKTPDDIKVLDMATLCKSNLVRDLIYIFATSPTPDDKQEPLLDIYLKSLRFYLSQSQVDDQKYTLSLIQSEMKRLRHFKLFISVILAMPTQFTSVPKFADIASLDKEQIQDVMIKHLGIGYDNRIRWVVNKFYQTQQNRLQNEL